MTFGPITVNRPGATATVGVMGPIGAPGTPGTNGGTGPQGPAVFTPIAAWVSGLTYQPGTATQPASYVSIGGSSYACTTLHTSGVFAADLEAVLWEPVALQGVQGNPGTPGSTWYSGLGAPQPTIGINGDYFLRTDTYDVLLKVSGAWSKIGNLQGSPGNTIRTGLGAPAASVGVAGDSYIDVTPGAPVFWGPKGAAGWPSSGTSMVGPTGPGNGSVNSSGTTTPGDVVVYGKDGNTIQDSGVPLSALARIAFRNNVGDANTALTAADRTVATSIVFTAPRTWTLAAANSVPAGTSVRVLDAAGAVTMTNTLTLATVTGQGNAAPDTLNGATSCTYGATFSDFLLTSDGVSRWTYDVQGLARGGTGVAASSNVDLLNKLGAAQAAQTAAQNAFALCVAVAY